MMNVLSLVLLLAVSAASGQSRGTTLQAHTPVDTLGFTVGPSLFSGRVLDSLVTAGVHVDSLVVYPKTIYVTEGGSFELKKMYVLALDAQGDPVPRAPLELELDAFNCTFGTERIMGFSPGKARMRVVSLLPVKDGKTRTGVEIDVRITPWPNE